MSKIQTKFSQKPVSVSVSVYFKTVVIDKTCLVFAFFISKGHHSFQTEVIWIPAMLGHRPVEQPLPKMRHTRKADTIVAGDLAHITIK